jgi:hypothetical protein
MERREERVREKSEGERGERSTVWLVGEGEMEEEREKEKGEEKARKRDERRHQQI